MFKTIRKWFQPPTAAEVLRKQHFEAQRMHAEHTAAGEHHLALARMYDARVERIQSQLADAGVPL